MKHSHTYQFLDSGDGLKLERFGKYILARPCAQAVWRRRLPLNQWREADASFSREPENTWHYAHKLPPEWVAELDGLSFKIMPTDFGHLGVFPEHHHLWLWVQDLIKKAVAKDKEELHVLNLFAYSGGASLAAARAGAHVCHLDASKGMVAWARENAALNNLDKARIRWIIDDVHKFLVRESRRGKRYDGIILDPPTFGRGAQGEIFKIERDLPALLESCKELLVDDPLFVVLSCHTPGYSPLVMRHMMAQMMGTTSGRIEEGEMVLEGKEDVLPLPSGTFARWVKED